MLSYISRLLIYGVCKGNVAVERVVNGAANYSNYPYLSIYKRNLLTDRLFFPQISIFQNVLPIIIDLSLYYCNNEKLKQ